jgi:hypothetical protein
VKLLSRPTKCAPDLRYALAIPAFGHHLIVSSSVISTRAAQMAGVYIARRRSSRPPGGCRSGDGAASQLAFELVEQGVYGMSLLDDVVHKGDDGVVIAFLERIERLLPVPEIRSLKTLSLRDIIVM